VCHHHHQNTRNSNKINNNMSKSHQPERDFVTEFYKLMQKSTNTNNDNTGQILYWYNAQFNKVSERYFKNSNWPPVETILPYANNDENFGLLYEIMRTRHMHMRLGLHKVGMEVLANSFHHYTKLFYKIMNGEFLFDLPNEWLWDLMDEFLYQFQTFRQKKSQQQEESDKVWSTREVLTTLEKLVQASQIEQLLNSPHQRSLDLLKPGKNHTLTILGYYAMIGLLRVHTILGDFATALEAVNSISLFGSADISAITSKGGSARIIFNEYIFSRVISCQVTLFYYYTFCCLASGKYYSAVRLLNLLLIYLNRCMSKLKFSGGTSDTLSSSFQNEFVAKMSDQCYGLLAVNVIMLTACSQSSAGVFIAFTSKSLPGGFRLEENVRNNLREKFGDKMNKISRSMINGTNEYVAIIGDILNFCAPKLINPTPNSQDDNASKFTRLFVEQGEVSQLAQLSPVKSWIRMFTKTDLKVLSKQIKTSSADGSTSDITQLRDLCHSLKHKSVYRLISTPASNVVAPDEDIEVQFVLQEKQEGDVEVYVGTEKVWKHYAEWFIRHAHKFESLRQTI